MYIKLIGSLNCLEGGGNYDLFLLILYLQIYYWQCLGFHSPKKGILISVLSPAGYFFFFFFIAVFILLGVTPSKVPPLLSNHMHIPLTMLTFEFLAKKCLIR